MPQLQVLEYSTKYIDMFNNLFCFLDIDACNYFKKNKLNPTQALDFFKMYTTVPICRIFRYLIILIRLISLSRRFGSQPTKIT